MGVAGRQWFGHAHLPRWLLSGFPYRDALWLPRRWLFGNLLRGIVTRALEEYRRLGSA